MKRRLCMGLAAVCMLMALSGCGKRKGRRRKAERRKKVRLLRQQPMKKATIW